MPAAFLQLERNRQYWPRMPYPAVGDQVSFKGSELLYQYFAGEGLQLHPLSTFKKANHLHGACEREEPTCDEAALPPHPRRDGPRWPSSAAAASSPGSTSSTSAAARRPG